MFLRRLLLAFLLLGILFFSCKKAAKEYIRDLLEAEVIYRQNIIFPYPLTTDPVTTNTVVTPQVAVPMNVDSVIQAETDNKFGKQDLQSVKMTSIKLYMPNTTPITASALDTILLTAQVSSSPDILKIEVVKDFKITTEQDQFILDLPVDSNRELVNYLSAPSVNYSLYGKFKNELTFSTIGLYNMIFTYKLLVRKN